MWIEELGSRVVEDIQRSEMTVSNNFCNLHLLLWPRDVKTQKVGGMCAEISAEMNFSLLSHLDIAPDSQST